MVVFSSLEFIFRFIPIFLICYYLIPRKYQNAVLFVGSVIFYAVGEPVYVVLLLVLVVLNYYVGSFIWLRKKQDLAGSAKGYLAGIVLLDVFVLVTFKVLALTTGDSSLLPLGLSFYIFKMISYQCDIYQGKMVTRPGLAQTATYFVMFPQLVEGPIMRFADGGFTKEEPRHISLRRFEDGVVFFVMGLGMKILLADRIGILWNEIQKIGFESISTPLAWIGAFGYTFQLYFDFWGYSLMAAGLGLCLGFPFILNFDHPYAASGIGDFYRRWHATLGAWFRDYIYIPLGGSRNGAARTMVNLLVVWVITGFWHGGTANYVIWGLVLGLLIIWEKFVVGKLMKRFPIIGRIHVWVLIPLTWVIFAIPDIQELQMYFTRLFPFFGTGVAVNQTDFLKFLGIYWPFFLVSILLCQPVIYRTIVKRRNTWQIVVLLAIVFWASMFFMTTASSNPFMYFNF